MSTIYQRAPKHISEMAAGIIEEYHPELGDVEIKLDILVASLPAADTETEAQAQADKPALTVNGYPARAATRILSHRDRVKGNGDAEISIDSEAWKNMSDPQRKALLDHELYHLEVARSKEGEYLSDDGGRPKLRLRKHDRHHGWFDEVAKRHGCASVEVSDIMRVVLQAKQAYFPFMETDETDEVTVNFPDGSDKRMTAPELEDIKRKFAQ
jgi:hypothetical protein